MHELRKAKESPPAHDKDSMLDLIMTRNMTHNEVHFAVHSASVNALHEFVNSTNDFFRIFSGV